MNEKKKVLGALEKKKKKKKRVRGRVDPPPPFTFSLSLSLCFRSPGLAGLFVTQLQARPGGPLWMRNSPPRYLHTHTHIHTLSPFPAPPLLGDHCRSRARFQGSTRQVILFGSILPLLCAGEEDPNFTRVGMLHMQKLLFLFFYGRGEGDWNAQRLFGVRVFGVTGLIRLVQDGITSTR